jgi:hypothetical protein
MFDLDSLYLLIHKKKWLLDCPNFLFNLVQLQIIDKNDDDDDLEKIKEGIIFIKLNRKDNGPFIIQ